MLTTDRVQAPVARFVSVLFDTVPPVVPEMVVVLTRDGWLGIRVAAADMHSAVPDIGAMVRTRKLPDHPWQERLLLAVDTFRRRSIFFERWFSVDDSVAVQLHVRDMVGNAWVGVPRSVRVLTVDADAQHVVSANLRNPWPGSVVFDRDLWSVAKSYIGAGALGRESNLSSEKISSNQAQSTLTKSASDALGVFERLPPAHRLGLEATLAPFERAVRYIGDSVLVIGPWRSSQSQNETRD